MYFGAFNAFEKDPGHTLSIEADCRLHIYGADGAARLLGVKPTTLQSRMKKLGVRR